MKIQACCSRVAVAALVLLLTLAFQPATIFAQGALTPPGAPTPTMKSLDQIEARTAITNTASLVTITQPGSYYLTQSLTVSSGDGIDINTNGVTLDLNGFTISSTASGGSGNGIYLSLASGNTDITILNGHFIGNVTNNAGTFSGFGFNSGIGYNGFGVPSNIRVLGVSVSGCLSAGIILSEGNSTMVESCTVKTVGGTGILADNVSHCTAHECRGTAISAANVSDSHGESDGFIGGSGIFATTANNCYGSCVSSGYGVYATTANNCYGYSTGTNSSLFAATANNCYGYNATNGTGLFITGVAIGCYGQSALGTAINAHIANSCVVGGGGTATITFKYNMP